MAEVKDKQEEELQAEIKKTKEEYLKLDMKSSALKK